MRKHGRLGVLIVFSTLFLSLSCTSAAAQESGNPAYSWVNGKWTGPAPGGGELEMDLRLINDNQVAGSGQIRGAGGAKGYRPVITGIVKGERVTLDLRNPNSGNNVKLELSLVDGTLKGTRKGEEVVFKKQQ
ncbi:MAG TPA: hypothetical protein VGR30_19500 [Candidatus Binatia bacterium]|jgi:hypothetical protein|nr:hypothetical protein [Candidatus Binatia bacterium]